MSTQDLLHNIKMTYLKAFESTPTEVRLGDILKESFELTRTRRINDSL